MSHLIILLCILCFKLSSQDPAIEDKNSASLKQRAFDAAIANPKALAGKKAFSFLNYLDQGCFDSCIAQEWVIEQSSHLETARKKLNIPTNHVFLAKFNNSGTHLIAAQRERPGLFKITTNRSIFMYDLNKNKKIILTQGIPSRDSSCFDINDSYVAYIHKNKNQLQLNVRNLANDDEENIPVSCSSFGKLLLLQNEALICRGYNNILEFYTQSKPHLITKTKIQFSGSNEFIDDIYELDGKKILITTTNHRHSGFSHYYMYDRENNENSQISLPSNQDATLTKICDISPDKKTALWLTIKTSQNSRHITVGESFIIQNIEDRSTVNTSDSGPYIKTIAHFISHDKIIVIQENIVHPAYNNTIKNTNAFVWNILGSKDERVHIHPNINPLSLFNFKPALFNHYNNVAIKPMREYKKSQIKEYIETRTFKLSDYLPTEKEKTDLSNVLLAKAFSRLDLPTLNTQDNQELRHTIAQVLDKK